LREFITGYYPDLATVLREFNNHADAVIDGTTDIYIANFFRNVGIGNITDGSVSSSSLSDLTNARKGLSTHAYNVNLDKNNQTIFRVHPHIATKVSCSVPGTMATVSLKGGGAYISGHTSCALWDKPKNFSVVSPLVGAEVRWSLKGDWSVGIELNHLFKVTKKFEEIKVLGMQINPKVNVKRTSLGISFSHNFC
jgi:hypothetical protein